MYTYLNRCRFCCCVAVMCVVGWRIRKFTHTLCMHLYIIYIYIYIIIIIIIWHYSPLWVFAFSAKSLQVRLSLATSFQFLTLSFYRSSMTSSCHLCLGLPTCLVPIVFQSNSFPVGPARSILWICPNHLILRTHVHISIFQITEAFKINFYLIRPL